MAEGVADFVAFTGASTEQAEQFLEIAGGNVEAAVGLFFSSQEDGAPPPGDDVAMVAGDVGEGARPPWWDLIWPSAQAPPEAWREQRLAGTAAGWPGGIDQPKNGPCGVLAAVHGLVLAEQHGRDLADVRLAPEVLAETIFGILSRCRPDDGAPIVLVKPVEPGNYGPGAGFQESTLADAGAAAAEISARITDFQGPGGVLDLLHSAVLTRGAERVRAEALGEGGELPLVTQNFNAWLCNTELMSLLLRGTAGGNVGAFHGDGSPNNSWDGTKVGMLSKSEKETGVPVANALKNPVCPVWVLHGGDHFTLAWAREAPSDETGAAFTLYHWNGLPPGGPRLSKLSVAAPQGAVAGATQAPKFYKPEPNEIDEVVQADPEDKKARPEAYRTWRYEVLLAWDDPQLQGEPRPDDVPLEPKFDQEDTRYQRDGAWRCRLCYARRFQTMDFALVPADSPDACPKCEKPRKDCGWSLWVPFSDLPPKHQANVMGRHAKKVETILWTKWPNAEVSADEGPLPDC